MNLRTYRIFFAVIGIALLLFFAWIYFGSVPVPQMLSQGFESSPLLQLSSAASAILQAGESLTGQETPQPAGVPFQERRLLAGTPQVFLPTIYHSDALPAAPRERALYCITPAEAIPDAQNTGIRSTLHVEDGGYIEDLDVQLDIPHTWVSDLSIQLTHEASGREITLMNRPGLPGTEYGCRNDNIGAILDDDVTLPVEKQCAASPAAISGMYTPDEPLASFRGEPIRGNWTLTVTDHSIYDTGRLRKWCLAVLPSAAPPSPKPPPPAISVPASARIYNISGKAQALPLDCESRVAVDWAGYFGVYINEYEFFNRLPKSDNPDKGFVGNVYGVWGQIPPYPYGVHAEPVAALLREYGLEAYVHRPLSWDRLRQEVAAGRPVFVWVIGPGTMNEIPLYYTSRDGHTSIVAHYEHVVQVIGYTDTTVTVLDGGTVKTISRTQFLSSFSALHNMAITARP